MPEERTVKLDELGATGLKRSGTRSLIDEEFLPQLKGTHAIKIYREMRDNDPVIGAILFAIEMLIRQVDWRVEGDEELTKFVESCLTDMSTGWDDVVAEILSMLVYGWSWHEVVYKRRMGPDQTDASKKSMYNDGKIGWRKMPIRSQDSLSEWVFDDEGGIQFMKQSAPPDYKEVEIPIERSLLFRTGLHKGNPEGRSILRNAYRPWFFKKRIEEIEGVGVERDLAGLPVIYRTAEIAAAYDTELKKILRNVRRDEQEGLLLPLAYDDKGNKLLLFELLSAAGQRQLNVDAVIQRYDKRIAMTCLADFILLGQQSVGSFALASSKTELFSVAIGTVMKSIAGVMNRYAIPRLLSVNGMMPKEAEDLPRMVPGDVESPDLAALGQFITALAGAGATLFPDEELEQHLRKLADLPQKSEEMIAEQKAAAEQQKKLQEAQQKAAEAAAKAPPPQPPPAAPEPGGAPTPPAPRGAPRATQGAARAARTPGTPRATQGAGRARQRAGEAEGPQMAPQAPAQTQETTPGRGTPGRGQRRG